MGCPTTTVKISSIILNVLLAILGIAAIVLVATFDTVPEDWCVPAYIIFAFVILFAIFGCVAALRESICLTVTCAVFLLMLAILQVIVTINIINDRNARTGIAKVQDAWERDAMDALQLEYQCCGKDSSQDYVLLNRLIPLSCYEGQNDADANRMFTEGCSTTLQRYHDNETTITAATSWVFVGLEIVGFLLAVFLAINFRNKQRRMQF